MKLITASAALLLTISTLTVSAQPRQGHAPQGGEKPSAEKIAEIATDKLDQRLELTDAQEKKVYAINLKYAKEREANKPEQPKERAEGEKQERPDREAMQAKMKAAKDQRKAQMVEIMKVLSDEQKIDYAFMLSQPKPQQQPQQGGKARQGGKGKQNNDRQGGKREAQGPERKGRAPQGEQAEPQE